MDINKKLRAKAPRLLANGSVDVAAPKQPHAAGCSFNRLAATTADIQANNAPASETDICRFQPDASQKAKPISIAITLR
ncbi:MAG: hypothetical protein GC159_14310 [Phycisphaera sp.]|nr:hypothetical protein [Phycisphaera sp.]